MPKSFRKSSQKVSTFQRNHSFGGSLNLDFYYIYCGFAFKHESPLALHFRLLSTSITMPITSSIPLNSPSNQNHSEYSNDEAYHIASPCTLDGNQMAYYFKYGHSPPGPNSTAALHARTLEWLATANVEQGTVSNYRLKISDFS